MIGFKCGLKWIRFGFELKGVGNDRLIVFGWLRRFFYMNSSEPRNFYTKFSK